MWSIAEHRALFVSPQAVQCWALCTHAGSPESYTLGPPTDANLKD